MFFPDLRTVLALSLSITLTPCLSLSLSHSLSHSLTCISSMTATSNWLLMLAISTVHDTWLEPGTRITSWPVTCMYVHTYTVHICVWTRMYTRTVHSKQTHADRSGRMLDDVTNNKTFRALSPAPSLPLVHPRASSPGRSRRPCG